MGKHKSEKRSRNVVSSDEEDVPDPKNQKNDDFKDSEFDALFDEDEREKLNKMSEKDRETEIFKRIEMNQILKTREEIKKKLEMAQKAEEKKTKNYASSSKERELSNSSESSDSSASEFKSEEEDLHVTLKKKNDKFLTKKKKIKHIQSENEKESSFEDFDTEFHRPSDLANKHNKKKAMDVLLSKRRDKKEAEEKRKQKAALDIDEIFGDGDAKSGASNSSSSSRSSSPESSKNSVLETKLEITRLEELSRCRISRYRLAQFVHAPFFNKLAIGCFVRVGIGNGPDGRPVYRVAQIMDIVETAKIYQVEKTKTNKGLRLKHGSDERVYRLEFVSNNDFTSSEFQHWLKAIKFKNLSLPSLDFVERKEKDIKNYSNYKFTNSDIDYMVKEKTKFSKSPSNFAFRKGELLKTKEFAEQSGDFQQVQELQAKIDELDSRADLLDRQRSQKLSVVTWINQRNRDHMKQSFLSDGTNHVDVTVQDDPFTRKSGKMKVVSGVSKTRRALIADKSIQLSKNVQSLSKNNFCKYTTKNNSTLKIIPNVSTVNTESKLPNINDLFSAHDIEIDIPLKLPIVGPSLTTSTSNKINSESKNTSKAGCSRTLTLEEYKKKRGLL